MTRHPNTPAYRNEAASVVEQIAQQWDGCMYDSVGGDIDIGQAIRDAGKDLAASRTEQAAPSVASGVEKEGAVATSKTDDANFVQAVEYAAQHGWPKDAIEWLERIAIGVRKRALAAPGAAIAAREQPAGWEKLRENLALAILGFATREGRKSLEAAGQMLDALADGPMPYLRAASRQEAPAASAKEASVLAEISTLLTSMFSGAREHVRGPDQEVVGYTVRTGALHKIVGLLASYKPVIIPSNLPKAHETITGILTATSEARSPATVAQPVGWQVRGIGRDDGPGEWHHADAEDLQAYRNGQDMWELRPVFAQPCPSQGCGGDGGEELTDDEIDSLQEEYDCFGQCDAPRIHDFARGVEKAVRAALSGLEHVGKESE